MPPWIQSNRNSHSLLVGMQIPLENSLTTSYKTKHTLTIQPSNCTPWYVPKLIENLYSHKNLCTNVYSTFIHNCKNLEVTRMSSIGEWINKVCLSIIQQNIIQYQKEMSYQAMKRHAGSSNAFLGKEASREGLLHDFTYMTLQKAKTLQTMWRSVIDRS